MQESIDDISSEIVSVIIRLVALTKMCTCYFPYLLPRNFNVVSSLVSNKINT